MKSFTNKPEIKKYIKKHSLITKFFSSNLDNDSYLLEGKRSFSNYFDSDCIISFTLDEKCAFDFDESNLEDNLSVQFKKNTIIRGFAFGGFKSYWTVTLQRLEHLKFRTLHE